MRTVEPLKKIASLSSYQVIAFLQLIMSFHFCDMFIHLKTTNIELSFGVRILMPSLFVSTAFHHSLYKSASLNVFSHRSLNKRCVVTVKTVVMPS